MIQEHFRVFIHHLHFRCCCCCCAQCSPSKRLNAMSLFNFDNPTSYNCAVNGTSFLHLHFLHITLNFPPNRTPKIIFPKSTPPPFSIIGPKKEAQTSEGVCFWTRRAPTHPSSRRLREFLGQFNNPAIVSPSFLLEQQPRGALPSICHPHYP